MEAAETAEAAEAAMAPRVLEVSERLRRARVALLVSFLCQGVVFALRPPPRPKPPDGPRSPALR